MGSTLSRITKHAPRLTFHASGLTYHFLLNTDYYSLLTDQIRRSSRSVCANIAGAWRKRRYEAAFISKLNDAESEACETQVWLQFAESCNNLPPEVARELCQTYDGILGQLVNMIRNSAKWTLPRSPSQR
jgi:four helix bundle protein